MWSLSEDDDCDDAPETLLDDDCDDGEPAASPDLTETTLGECVDSIDQDCDGLPDALDPGCACSALRVGFLDPTNPSTFVCPTDLPVVGAPESYTLDSFDVTLVEDPDTGIPDMPIASCSPPFLVRVDSTVRGLVVKEPVNGMAPLWIGTPQVEDSSARGWFPDNCEWSGGTGCIFPGTPTSAPVEGCYAVSFWAPDPSYPYWTPIASAGTILPVTVASNRRSDGAERIDIHAVTAGATPITQAQIRDALSYAATYWEPIGLSLGEISFESIADYETVVYPDELSAMFSAPTRAGASAQAITVVFVDTALQASAADPDVLEPISGLLGASPVPGVPGLNGGVGSGLFIQVSEYEEASFLIQMMGMALAHEIGHFTGLRHTSELNGYQHDALPDTPECTNGGPDFLISRDECVGQGTANVMFPQAASFPSATTSGFTPQRTQVYAALAPRPLVACADHPECGDEEICWDGACATAWARRYVWTTEGALIGALGPDGEWDEDFSPPDPYVYASSSWGWFANSNYSAVAPDTFSPTWDRDLTFRALQSETDILVNVWDDDPTINEIIDSFPIPAPLSIDLLRDGSGTMVGPYCSLDYHVSLL